MKKVLVAWVAVSASAMVAASCATGPGSSATDADSGAADFRTEDARAADSGATDADKGAPTAPIGDFAFGMTEQEALAICREVDPDATIAGCLTDPATTAFSATEIRLTFLNGRLTTIQYMIDSPLEAGLGPYQAALAGLRERYGGDGGFACPFSCVDADCLESEAQFQSTPCQPDERIITTRTWLTTDYAAQLSFWFGRGRDPDLRVIFTVR